MPKPTKTELAKYRATLLHHMAVLRGDVGSMKDEALRASEQDNSVDHLADQGSDNYDQSFLLGLIENEEETIVRIEEALERVEGRGDWPYGACPACLEESKELKPEPKKPAKTTGGKAAASKASPAKSAKKPAKAVKPAKNAKTVKAEPWIPKERLEYVPWAKYCVRHQEEEESNRNIA
ncbi:MAG: hypothetical protein IT458_19975 [Planctomycetes bacterium]|nr:hypothetical protein [Planctomycetota bacterium]